jgi:ketosteroid isomerase-like protein
VAGEDVQRLRAIYDAFDRGDVDGWVGLLAHDIEWSVPETLPWGGTRHGHEGVRVFRELLDEHVEGGWGTPEEFLETDDRIVVLGRFNGRARATGREFEMAFAHVWAFSDGVPVRYHNYSDTATALAALRG